MKPTLINKLTKFIFLLLLILTLSLVVSGCSDQKPGLEDISPGGTVTSTTTVLPRTFNPLLAEETDSSRFTHYYIFEPLAVPDGKTYELKPCLAKNWVVQQDGKVWIFNLREDVRWHDGEKFTAEDVVFTFKLIYDHNFPTSYRKNLLIAGEQIKVESTGQYTVKLTLPEPYAPLLRRLPVIVPKHKLYTNWQQGSINRIWTTATDPEKIVGTGPFQLSSYQPGRELVLKDNPDYWQTDQLGRQLPYIDRWVRRIVHTPETEWDKFTAGSCDYVQIDNQNYAELKKQAKKDNYQLVNGGPALRTTFIVFNQNPDSKTAQTTPEKLNWFTNLHFRRAVAHAVDRQQIINQVFGGQAQPQWSPLSRENSLFYNNQVRQYPYNLEAARRELKTGGFSWNQAGELVGPKGNRVKFELATNQESTKRRQMLQIIETSLEQLGIKVQIDLLEFNQLIAQLVNKYNYDGILIGLRSEGIDPDLQANIWQSGGKLHLWHPNQKQPATDWEAEINRLFNQGAKTMDQTERQRIYNRWQQIAAEKLPLIYLVNKEQVFAVQTRLQNLQITSYGTAVWGEPLWNAERVYLRSNEQD